MFKRSPRLRGRKGFTLLELMVVAGIAITALVGLLGTYVAALTLTETTRSSELAMLSAQAVLEDMRTTAFTGIYSAFNGYTTTVDGLDANASVIRVTVNDSNANLLNVTVGACWRQKGGRIIGECYDASGTVTFNDTNGNHVLDSPVQIMTLMAQR
ncbi:MAG: type IV pilus modification PilV family protein [Deltaproteobacteria bacterium]